MSNIYLAKEERIPPGYALRDTPNGIELIDSGAMIATHTNPDLDAIGGVWLLQRFGGLEDARIEYVNTGNPPADVLAQAAAVVDTGQRLDWSKLRFDHHHLPGAKSNETCATLEVFKFLNRDQDLDYLFPLVNLIYHGDTGREEADQSRLTGIHALLSGLKAGYREHGEMASNTDIMSYGCALLSTLEIQLRNQAKAVAELDEKTVYRSDDGLVWAIRHGSAGSSFAAFERGARLVVFEGKPIELADGTTSYPIGIWRAAEWQEPHCGELVERVERRYPDEFAEELGRWFRHEAGFFAGRGTGKAPMQAEIEVNLQRLAMAIDEAWRSIRGGVT